MRKHKYNYMFDTYNITQQFLQECFEYNEQDGKQDPMGLLNP